MSPWLVDYQIIYLLTLNRIGIGIGTPVRLNDLVKSGKINNYTCFKIYD